MAIPVRFLGKVSDWVPLLTSTTSTKRSLEGSFRSVVEVEVGVGGGDIVVGTLLSLCFSDLSGWE